MLGLKHDEILILKSRRIEMLLFLINFFRNDKSESIQEDHAIDLFEIEMTKIEKMIFDRNILR